MPRGCVARQHDRMTRMRKTINTMVKTTATDSQKGQRQTLLPSTTESLLHLSAGRHRLRWRGHRIRVHNWNGVTNPRGSWLVEFESGWLTVVRRDIWTRVGIEGEVRIRRNLM